MQTQGSAAPSAGTSAGVATSSGASTADMQTQGSAAPSAGTSAGVAASAAAATDSTPKAATRTSAEVAATPGAATDDMIPGTATDDMMQTQGSPDSGSGRPKRERNKRVISEPPGRFPSGNLVFACFCACPRKGWACVQYNTAAVSSGSDLSYTSGHVCKQDLMARRSWLQGNPKRRVHSRRRPRQQKLSNEVWSARFRSLCGSAA